MEAVISVVGIFALRVINNAIATIRVIATANGRRGLAMILAFVESFIFAYAAGVVLTNLSNIPNLLAYAAGFAVGGYVGILIEERFVIGYVTMNIVSTQHGADIARHLRGAGYGVTETTGTGQTGHVSVLISVILRQDTQKVLTLVHEVDPKAFITVETARSAQQGWVRSVRTHFR